MSYTLRASSRTDGIRRFIRRVSPRNVYQMAAELSDGYWGAIRIGYKQYSALRALYPDRCSLNSTAVEFKLPQLNHPVWIRPGTTDANEVVHTVVREAYGSLLPEGPVRLIVDAGANIGDTTVWYLNKFPDATVVALEPDVENHALLVRNCNPYGTRAIPLNAALWPTNRKLALHRSGMASGHSVSASPNPSPEDATEGVPIPALLASINKRGAAAIDAIDILKCDIEGAEVQVFGESSDEWLPKIRCILIEIHGAAAYETVMGATRRHGFHHRVYRDTHIFWH